jgi:hypothetical protein
MKFSFSTLGAGIACLFGIFLFAIGILWLVATCQTSQSDYHYYKGAIPVSSILAETLRERISNDVYGGVEVISSDSCTLLRVNFITGTEYPEFAGIEQEKTSLFDICPDAYGFPIIIMFFSMVFIVPSVTWAWPKK